LAGGFRVARFLFCQQKGIPMPDTATLERKTEEQHVPRKLLARNFVESEFAYADISVTIPVGHTIEDALKPEYWAHVAHRLQQNVHTGQPDRSGAIIRLRTEDHALFAMLYVRAVRNDSLDVALIGEPTYFGPSGAVKSDAYETRWNVGARGFDVIRKSDGAIVGRASDFRLKENAIAYIRDVLKG
jgi:hypothetical protein